MAQQRTVSVKVSLVAQDYFNGLRKMQDETKKTEQSASASFGRQKAAFETLGRGALATSVVFAGAFVAMVKASADFEQRMSQVQALSKATSAQMDKLRGSAFTAGQAFGLSATQVADAEIELTKAGVSVKDIIGGALPGALALAAAGQIDVAKATEIASNAMTEFKLRGADVPHVADLLAASADKSVGSVESVGDALNQSGLVAAQFGLSIEDTVGTLTAFSKAGLNGSDAGTSFKTMLTQLASPTKQAQAALDKYNITTYDAQGNFVGITSLAQQLHDNLGGLPSVYGKVSQAQRNNALSTIFGNDAIRASSALYDLGGKKLQGYIDANNEAGFAALQASKKLDNLNGDVQKLGASFQNDLIKSGSAGNDALRGVTQTASGLLTVFGDLPKPIQGSALAIAGVGAAVTAGSAAFLLLTPRVAAAKAAMADLNITTKGAALGFAKGAGLAIGIAAVTSGLANLASQGQTTEQQLNLAAKSAKSGFGDVDSLFKGNSFGGAKGAAEALKRSFSGNFFENDSAGTKLIDGLTFGITKFSDTYKSNEGQFKALGEQLAALSRTDYSRATGSFNDLVEKFGGGNEAARQALQAFPAYREEIVKLLNASGKAATEQNVLAAATGRGGVASAISDAQSAARTNAQTLNKMAGSAADASVDISALSKTIAGFGGAALDARSAERAFEQAVDDASAAARKNGKTLDTSTAAGRDNQAALDGIASSAAAAASKLLEETGSQEQAAGAIRKGRKDFINAATQMGLTRSAAGKLADQLGLIPSNVKTAVGITGLNAALNGISIAKAALESLNGRTATVAVHYQETGRQLATGGVQSGFASGGSISGPGPKGKDSVLAYLAPGEHVLTAREVDKMGGQSAVYAFRAGLDAYAAGGAIGDSTSAAAKAKKQAAQYAKQLSAAKKDDKSAQHAYDTIGSAKKDQARKKAAKARLDAADKRVDAIQKKLDDAKQRQQDANSAAAELRNDREDFVSTQRRATPGNPIDPLSYIDQLRSMSRDDNLSSKRRTAYDAAANKYEKALVSLTTQSEAAASKLSDLKSSADSMRSSITSSIAGGYQLSGVPATAGTTTGSVMRNGIRFTTTGAASGVSASSIDAYYRQGATDTASFAADLKALASRGVAPALLAELAGYGVTQGAPIAKALLSGTSSQLSSINASYGAIQGNAASAAGLVTDANYAALISDAQANADKIAGQIAADGEKLRKLIAQAFGLTGYAVGTLSATPGWHLVGEKGPEILNFAGGEQVATAARTRSMISAAQSRGNTASSGPSLVTIVDVDGTLIGHFATAARGVARQEIAADALADSVHIMYGGAA